MRLLLLALLPLAFNLTSCLENSRPQEKASFFSSELVSTYHIGEINENLVNEENIKAPPGTWQAALRLSAYANMFERVDYCLLVKIPYKLEPGKIKFVRSKTLEKTCSEQLFAPQDSAEVEFYNLYIDYNQNELVLKVDQHVHRYKFSNMSQGSLLVSNDNGATSSGAVSLLKDGEVCRQVNSDCASGVDRCDDCENGSYYIKDNSCAQAYTKICGVDNCGKKGEPACVRGQVSTGVKDYCIQDSPVGFCSGKNRVACVNGKLICE